MSVEQPAGQLPVMRPLRFGEILDVGFKVFTRNIAQLALATAVVIVPIAILQSLIQVSIDPTAFDPQSFDDITSGTTPTGGTDLETVLAGALVSGIVGAIGQQFATAACFKIVADAITGGKPAWKASIGFIVRRLHSVLWVGLLYMLATVLPFVPGALLLIVSLPLGVAVLVLGIIGWLLLSVLFAISLPALLLEDKRGTKALGRSAELVRARFWPTVGVYVIGLLLVYFVIGLVVGIVAGIVTFTVESSLVIAFFTTAVTALMQAIILPFTASILSLVYFDLRVRKEGFDLQLLAERIGYDKAPGFPAPTTTHPAPAPPPPDRTYAGGFSPPSSPSAQGPPPPPSFSPPPEGHGGPPDRPAQ